jgi:PAS domain S-box-containing protein
VLEERKLSPGTGGRQDHAAVEFATPAEPQIHIQSYWRFRDLLEAAPDAIIEVEQDGTIVLLNAAAEKVFGYPREELLGRLIDCLVPEALRHRHHEHRNEYAEHPITRPMGIGLELFAQRKDGTQFPVEISLSPIRSSQGSRVIAIVRDITGRKQADAKINAIHQQFAGELAATNQQLEIRNREVERANRLKSEFLASMSHELRTPLHTIIGFGDLLAEELKGALNPDQKRFVEHIQRDSRHLLELINDILDLSKIESGRLELHLEQFRAADAIAETIAGLRSLAENKHIRISELLDNSATVTADRLRFKEIFYNLVSNSIKFTPEKGRITVECRQEPKTIYFAVMDTGVGIDPSEQQAIFDKFYQLGSTTRGVREGTGLGLAITKSLVEMHGGRIWVESTPGEGSRFQFIIPRAESELPIRQMDLQASGSILVAGIGHKYEGLVDSLQQKGYEVSIGETVDQALSATRSARPAALVLDLLTFGPKTWTVLQDLRANEHTARTPVLALTTSEDQSIATSLGANAALTKPVNPTLLIKILEEKALRSSGEPSRILLVDDKAPSRQLISDALRSAGFLPVLASSGKQALEVLARSPTSAIVIDLLMPEMSGFELLLRVRQNPGFAELPMVVLTAKEVDQEDTQILSRQANAVLLKVSPWKEEFLTKIHELLEDLIKRSIAKE